MRTKQNQTNKKPATLPGSTACLWKNKPLRLLGKWNTLVPPRVSRWVGVGCKSYVGHCKRAAALSELSASTYLPSYGFKSISHALYLPVLVLWPLSDCRIERLFLLFVKGCLDSCLHIRQKVITQGIQRKIAVGCYKIEVFRMRMAVLLPDRALNVGWEAHLQMPTRFHHPSFTPRMKKFKGILQFSSQLHWNQ